MYSSGTKLKQSFAFNDIRKTFIDFFVKNHNHKHVRSSPVVPYCDPTVAFVNAGMNQFKSVFTGKCSPPYPRVANSQKCVRVGGKHNDLETVGKDGYHHTFFEMLGNWSFGDYYKREACEMALNLLQGPYQINVHRLYVSYFAGDEQLGLPTDLESYDIWRTLGFPHHKVVPFGASDNFWEMDITGPCGPCTEIHYDHRPDLGTSYDRAKLINAGRSDLTELWNLVFIQYNRNADSSLSLLSSHYVDTGMGFERLTALLQNKESTYDTDIFQSLFDTIQRISKTPQYNGSFLETQNQMTLDTGYRVLADHVRMVSVCLADGMLPDQNQKLRRVLRRAFKVEDEIFSNNKLMKQLIPVVVESLGMAYPELSTRESSIIEIVSHERDVYNDLRAKSGKAFGEALKEFPNLQNLDFMEYPGFVAAYRDFMAQKKHFENGIIPGKFLFKLYDTYGLGEESFVKLSELEGMKCDLNGYKQELSDAKLKFKSSLHSNSNFLSCLDEPLAKLTKTLPDTDDTFKYFYTYDIEDKCYVMEKLNAVVQGILLDLKPITSLNKSCFLNRASNWNDTSTFITIITDKSNFYYESGGQQSDTGKIFLKSKNLQNPDLHLKVVDIKYSNNCIAHICQIPNRCSDWEDFELNNGDNVMLSVDVYRRQSNIRHHTANHLINAAVRSLFKKTSYQVSNAVTSDQCKLELGIIGKRIQREDIATLDQLLQDLIIAAIPIAIDIIDVTELMQRDDITMIPGEVYPETGLRLINFDCDKLSFSSRELCCGTHVKNTKEIASICMTHMKPTSRARYAFTAVAGTIAERANKLATLIGGRMSALEKDFQTDRLNEIELTKVRNHLLNTTDLVLPYLNRADILRRIEDLLKRSKLRTRQKLNALLEDEIHKLLSQKPKEKYPFLLHQIRNSELVTEISLQQTSKICSDRSILIYNLCNGVLKAHCCVPKDLATNEFNAEECLRKFATNLGTDFKIKKARDSSTLCFMESKKIGFDFEKHIEKAMAETKEFAKQYFLANGALKK